MIKFMYNGVEVWTANYGTPVPDIHRTVVYNDHINGTETYYMVTDVTFIYKRLRDDSYGIVDDWSAFDSVTVYLKDKVVYPL